jgi:uracil-DNA glycosylase
MVIVGEAWGKGEAEMKKPFIGESGKELFRMLGEAFPLVEPELHREILELQKWGYAWGKLREKWLEAASIAYTNVFNLQPYNNKIPEICWKRKDLDEYYKNLGQSAQKEYPYPAIENPGGWHIQPEYLPELQRLSDELAQCAPKLIVLAGSKASWAFLWNTKISQVRGSVAIAGHVMPGAKVLPTYHPAGVMRNWSWRPIVVTDLMKAAREREFSELRRPSRMLLVNPTIEEVENWTEETLRLRPSKLSADTETSHRMITMISFSRSKSNGIIIPFVDETKKGFSYWPTLELELRAWKCVERLLDSPIPTLWQNGLYDLQYVLPMGLRARVDEDTMLLHHSKYPEMNKSLGFLGSIYTSEPSWKMMRTAKADTEKRDE